MTVAPAISQISRPETAGIPYLTAQEFTNAPTGVPISNLLTSGNATQQMVALQAVILRASSWMDVQCHQVLASTTDTEMARGRMRRDGSIYVFPRCYPIREVISVAVNYQPLNFTPLTSLANVVPLNRTFVIYQAPFPFQSNQGPIQFGPIGNWEECWVQYSYVNGYPVTTLADACAAAADSITVVSSLGMIPGMVLTISDNPNTETVGVESVSGNVVTLTGTTQYAHAEGIYTSSLPEAIKQAAILATSGFIRLRGSGAVTMASIGTQPKDVAGADPGGLEDLANASQILHEGGFVAQVSLPSQL
jgi:hypothetical protein